MAIARSLGLAHCVEHVNGYQNGVAPAALHRLRLA
jgi:hypothetical protein